MARWVSIDEVTGSRSKVADRACGAPGGIAAPRAPLIARKTEIIRLIRPADRKPRSPSEVGAEGEGHCLRWSGDLIVADATTGLPRISTATGAVRDRVRRKHHRGGVSSHSTRA